MSNGNNKNANVFPSKYFWKKSSQINLTIHATFESIISGLEVSGRFLYPYSLMTQTPLQQVVDTIKKAHRPLYNPSINIIGLHSYAYIKSFQFAGLSAASGLVYYGIDIRKNGFTRENSLMMAGNGLYAAEAFLRVKAMTALNLHMYEKISRRASGVGVVVDSTKMVNYLAEKDYPMALTYGLLSAGNLGMMIHSMENTTGVYRNLAGIYKTISPSLFFRAAIPLCFYSVYKIIYKNDEH